MVRTKCLKVLIRYKDSRQRQECLPGTTLDQNPGFLSITPRFPVSAGVLSCVSCLDNVLTVKHKGLVMLGFVALWILTIRSTQHHNP